MTDKQKIDKVNVKECKYYCNGKCERYEEFVEADYANYSVKCICEKENDLGTYDICDYQQLKRKEKECERLKKEVEFYTTPVRLGDYKPITLIIEELDHLKIENEVLKEKLETVYDDCKGCSSWNEALYNANLYAKEYRKLKQALQDIKEIVCRLLIGGVRQEILKKISEVENE